MKYLKTNSASALLLCVLTLLLNCSIDAAEQSPASSGGAKKECLVLSLASTLPEFSQDAAVLLNVKLENLGTNAVVYHDPVSPVWFFDFGVTYIDSRGATQSVRRTEYGDSLLRMMDDGARAKAEMLILQSGESFEIVWPVSRIFDMSKPGVYEVRVSVITPESERARMPGHVQRLSSKPVRIRVKQEELPAGRKGKSVREP